MLSNLIAYEA